MLLMLLLLMLLVLILVRSQRLLRFLLPRLLPLLALATLITGGRPLDLGPVIGVLARLPLALLAALVRFTAVAPVVTLAPLRRRAGRLFGHFDGG